MKINSIRICTPSQSNQDNHNPNVSPIMFCTRNSEKEESVKSRILTAKTKKTISECKYIAIGIIILYFSVKHIFRMNKIKLKKLEEQMREETKKLLEEAKKKAESEAAEKSQEEAGEKIGEKVEKVVDKIKEEIPVPMDFKDLFKNIKDYR